MTRRRIAPALSAAPEECGIRSTPWAGGGALVPLDAGGYAPHVTLRKIHMVDCAAYNRHSLPLSVVSGRFFLVERTFSSRVPRHPGSTQPLGFRSTGGDFAVDNLPCHRCVALLFASIREGTGLETPSGTRRITVLPST